MVYKVIGLMSGSSLDGLDIAYVHLQEHSGKWKFQFIHTATSPYPSLWKERLAAAPGLSALDYQLLHADYGHWLGEEVNRFITAHELAYQVHLVASHGHTALHLPARRMTAQLGDGAALAATTGINVVSDLRAMDIALGGQGAPIVPAGERLLFPGHGSFLNLGGIANISDFEPRAAVAPAGSDSFAAVPDASRSFAAWDVCPCNRVLDMLAVREGRSFDEGGALASTGRVDKILLGRLNALPYYGQPYPKSLANDFGTDTVYPMLATIRTVDALRTYVEHIAVQVARAFALLRTTPAAPQPASPAPPTAHRLLVTGGGAHNDFLTGRLRDLLQPLNMEIAIPEKELIDYKEALIMALLGVLRWREENTALAQVTGARRDSIGGAVWIGQEI